MRHAIWIVLILASNMVWAEKAGLYLGAGVTTNTYKSQNDYFDDRVEDERATGWKVELGYIWDLGKPGGFHLGVAATYNDFGTIKAGENNPYSYYYPDTEIKFDANAFAVMVVLEQEIASWVDFVFKIGPASVDYQIEEPGYGYNKKDSATELGAQAVIAFVFFPTDYLAIELASQGTSFVDSDSYNDDVYSASTLSLALQYRF